MADSWNPDFAHLHPAFQQLQPVRCWEDATNWPSCEQLEQVLPAGLQAVSGQAIRFLPQDHTLLHADLYYEERIFQHGIVSTRPNWHDFFNALMWGVFPQSKVQINARHADDITQLGKKRSPQRDALTILDENGIIIAASRCELLQAMVDFAWQEVFWQQRAAWGQEIAGFIIGHALFEKLLTPYVGVTAHAVLMEVEDDFFTWELKQQQTHLDKRLAASLQHGDLLSPLSLNPVPVLGIPPWWAANESADFYQNTQYFRPKNRPRNINILFLE